MQEAHFGPTAPREQPSFLSLSCPLQRTCLPSDWGFFEGRKEDCPSQSPSQPSTQDGGSWGMSTLAVPVSFPNS